MMPAFSNAIASIVSPRNCWWSNPIDVIAPIGGAITLVESYRPPRPTSMTATSTSARRNSSNAIAVVASKNVGWTGSSPVALNRSAQSSTSPATQSQRLRVNRIRSDDEPFGEIHEVRRGVAGRAEARGDERGMNHRRDRTLAVGAGDVERRKRPLGMPERRAQS